MAIDPAWVTAWGQAATGVGAIVAGWIAFRGLDAWRQEVVGRRKAELAEEVLAQFYRAKDIMIWARFPDRARDGGSVAHSPEGSRTAQLRRAASAPVERLTHESQLFSELQASRYRFMAYFGEEAAKPFAALSEIHSEIITSAGELVRSYDGNAEAPDATRRDAWEDAIGWGDQEYDEIARRLDQAVSEIERICRPLIDENEIRRRRPLVRRFSI